MNPPIYTPLQVREIFHLEFLRWFSRKVAAGRYALKGGVNLRFFFKSNRYSEDMDIDVHGEGEAKLGKTVMDILASRGFSGILRSFGIEKIVPPDITKAKQTATTQRFKVHLLTAAGEDLFTKVEFSRRGAKGNAAVEPVLAQVLRAYKMAPLLISHYDASSAVSQKIYALAHRTILQARDIFDLFVLSPQVERPRAAFRIAKDVFQIAHENIFRVEFPQFRDTVLAYLEAEDQKIYGSQVAWDEIKLKTAHFLEEFQHGDS